eukprot:SAG31_NODE_7252_length_1742_cov_1.312842_1_plen_131_part_00
MQPTVVSARVAPAALTCESPERGRRISNLSTNAMSRIVVAVPVASRITVTDRLRWLDRHWRLSSRSTSDSGGDSNCKEGFDGHRVLRQLRWMRCVPWLLLNLVWLDELCPVIFAPVRFDGLLTGILFSIY